MDINYSLAGLPKISKEIITKVKNKTLLFYGQMGVGKTTLIKEICKALEVQDSISSPTFSLVNEYQLIVQQYEIMVNNLQMHDLSIYLIDSYDT